MYGPTPPVGNAVADPLDWPKQITLDVSIVTCKGSAGSLTINVAEAKPLLE